MSEELKEIVSIEQIQMTDVSVIEASQRAEYDIQIQTAKKYPRDLVKVKNNSVAIVTMSKETAESCRYTIPRGGKTLSGASVHLARIIAQQYGNLRVDARIKQITDRQVISEAVAFDLETNYAVKVEVRKSIMQNEYLEGKKTGRTYRMNDDMITVTGNACNAISFRNAVFNIIPKAITDVCYNASLRMITGDLNDEEKLISARKKAVDHFISTYNITEEQLLTAIGLRSINQIKAEQIADLRGLEQSLKDGDTTPEEAFLLTKKTNLKETSEEKETKRILEFIGKCKTIKELEKYIEYASNNENIKVKFDEKLNALNGKLM